MTGQWKNNRQPREMEMLTGVYLRRLPAPSGSGHPVSVTELVFHVEMKATIVVNPEVGLCLWRTLS